MKKIVILILVVLLSIPLLADKKQSMDEKEMMKKWMAFATPGEEHKTFVNWVGNWETITKMWMKPGDPPVESKGTAVAKLVLGGRYLKMRHKGIVYNMPFIGISTTGFDNYKKKYISTWIDNMGTGTLVTEGTFDKSGKILTEIGDMDDFITGVKAKFKTVQTIVDKNSYKMEMYHIYPGGKEIKSMEMFYKRVKK